VTLTPEVLRARLAQLEREEQEHLARANAAAGAAALCRELLAEAEQDDQPKEA
jgi:hypothetical protein